jgi:hypothetical protein
VLQEFPALIAAKAGAGIIEVISEREINNQNRRIISEEYVIQWKL